MKSYYIIFFYIVFIFCNYAYSTTIVVVDINSLIDNNKNYKKIIKEIELNQNKYLENFKIKEDELSKKLSQLENSKLILNESEINNQIENYNEEFNNFTILIEQFNFHYQNQIIKIREIVLREIIVLLEKFALENKIEIILDSTSYLIASNSINITEKINIELNKLDIKLTYENFEEN